MTNEATTIFDAIRVRHSTRAFLDKPVDKDTVIAILDLARFAPSGANLQPWQVSVVTGVTKETLSTEIISAHRSGPQRPDFSYYPEQWFEPYRKRRFQTGMALYNALGIKREEKDRREQQWEANYHFFGAPVGLIFFVDKRLGHGCWVDMGMFMQSVMLAAIGFGLATCPQASIGDYPDVVRRVLGKDDNMLVLCGMAIGYADTSRPENQYRTNRDEVGNFTEWWN